MTRINTNVSSMNAQKTLSRSNAALQQALTRLSTGLRINSGRDDPAGLIASEVLRSDIISTDRAISNTVRANQVIATADSALGQVSSLLNDIRGLVTEAANTGAMSEDQIAANQLQIDSSLEAINRIAQTTSFQGRKLLDGSLDFQTTAGGNFSDITDMQIAQANLGASGSMSVDIRVNTAATRAEITTSGTAYANAQGVVTFGSGLDYRNVDDDTTMTIYTSPTSAITSLKFTGGLLGQTLEATLDVTGTEIEVAFDSSGINTETIALIFDEINTESIANGWGVTASKDAGVGVVDAADVALGSQAFAQNTLTVDALTTGPTYNNMAIELTTHAAGNPIDITWTELADRSTLTIDLQTGTAHTVAAIAAAITAYDPGSGVILTGTDDAVAGSRATVNPANSVDTDATGDTGVSGGGVLGGDLVVQLTGETGSEFLNFQAGSEMAHIAAAINAISDTLSMTAAVADGTGANPIGTLELTSSNYGSSGLIDVDVVSEGTGGTFAANLSAIRDTGTDIDATVNGSATLGDGNTLTLSTAMLDLEATIAAGVEETISFTIDSGGALFQLGPDVVATQQARVGMQSLNTAQLRGETGRLYELGSGQGAALTENTTTAAKIVDEVITKVASLRGLLGAFQKTTLDTNIAALNATLEKMTEAESTIRDADFAAESAALTRAQILIQSGVSVLAIANSNPQNVLALLR